MIWYVVDLQGLYIDSEHEGFAEANARAVEFKKQGGQPKVMTKPRVGSLTLDPRDEASWKPKRQNPRLNPFVCPSCGASAPKGKGAEGVTHKEACVFLKRRRAKRNPEWTPRQQMQRAAAAEEAAKWQEKFAERWSSPEGRKHRRQAALDAARSYKGQQPISFIWATFARNGWTPEETDAFLEEVELRSNPPLEDHVEYEPHRTVRTLRTRYGVDEVESMLHDIDDPEDVRENPRRSGEDIYRMWHQKEPNGTKRVNPRCDWDEKLVCVGKAHHIVYRSGKWEKGNKKNDYIHHFDSKPSVYMREDAVENGKGGKTVESLFSGLKNADGQAEVAELASLLSFAIDDGTQDGHEFRLHTGAKVYGGVDKKTVLIIDPVYGPIVIKGGKMYFDERGIVL